ncbi:heavy-metal-associated domain-containing protein [Aurantibacter aestuarii]|uniref:Heavy metal transporter n=1 Tax=Aurantibacter aestuarii TaxID=1266046 RepID=A0A2T1N9D4_9FLAO|nr:heavy metal-associated domain-containing protein [Aurantibacter aestuarii]PSG88480.1 heavy metal transporter [Aurantibacter aestuarii]
MTHTYKVTGMTCNGCKASVIKHLNELEQVTSVDVNLKAQEAKITMSSHIPTKTLKQALPEKYTLSENPSEEKNVLNKSASPVDISEEKSKLEQLKPLLLILFYIATASNLMHYKAWNLSDVMLDFMGLFFIVFSFFKLLDLKGFPESFKMYDPLAKKIPVYGWIYPFLETALGIMFLMRFQIDIALIITLIILSITTIGVTKTLLNKKYIQCACLGTALKLPMTEATFIENAIMIIMAIMMLVF